MDILEKLEALRASREPILGSVDADAAGHMLNVPSKRFSTWSAKRTKILREGGTLTGILAAMPDPIGYQNGGAVWRATDVEKMRDAIAGSVGSVGRPRKAKSPETPAA